MAAGTLLHPHTRLPRCLRMPQGANRHLRERLQDVLQELEAAHAQLRILNGLQQQLEDATPGAAELAAAALEQERALQAARDAQVLQLLRAKVRGAATAAVGCLPLLGLVGFSLWGR